MTLKTTCRWTLVLALMCVVFGELVLAAPDLAINGYTLVSQRRLSVSVYEYGYRVFVLNRGSSASSVTANLTAAPSALMARTNSLTFGTIAAGARVQSREVFLVRHNRRLGSFQAQQLGWGFEFADPAAGETVQDQYSPVVEWYQRSGEAVKPVHTMLLPSGNLFFIEPYFGMAPSPYNVTPPASVEVQARQLLLPDDCDPATRVCETKSLTCSGHALMADGKLFFAGGSHGRWNLNTGQLLEGTGISDSLTYNPVSNLWVRNPDSIGVGSATSRPLRWYPTGRF